MSSGGGLESPTPPQVPSKESLASLDSLLDDDGDLDALLRSGGRRSGSSGQRSPSQPGGRTRLDSDGLLENDENALSGSTTSSSNKGDQDAVALWRSGDRER